MRARDGQGWVFWKGQHAAVKCETKLLFKPRVRRPAQKLSLRDLGVALRMLSVPAE